MLQTAVDAYSYNFRVIVASDAVATHEPDLHDPSLALLQKDYRQKVNDTDSIIDYLGTLTDN
jgi:isochorismate hydrolase